MAKYRTKKNAWLKKGSGKRGPGGIKKGNWLLRYSPESLRHKHDYHVEKVMKKLTIAPQKEMIVTQTSQPKNKVNTAQVVNDSPQIKPSIEVKSSKIPQHKIPFTSTSQQIQPISPYMISEYFRQGKYHLLDKIIMDTESPILIGKLDKMTFVLKYEDVLERLANKRLNLVICSIDKKHYMGIYINETNEIYLISDITKENVVFLTPYKKTSISVCDNLDSYTVKDLRYWHLCLSCLSYYPKKKA